VSDKTVTEREAVLRERAAYTRGVVEGRTHNAPRWSSDAIAIRAGRHYPRPTVTRPRVVRDPLDASIEWTVLYDHLHWRRVAGDSATDWMLGPQGAPLGRVTAELCRVWADLLANPNEDVEAES
jgi:hypothetical protein